jgi:hypothetical protein
VPSVLREQDRHPVEDLGLARIEPIDRHRAERAVPQRERDDEQRGEDRRAAGVADVKAPIAQVGQGRPGRGRGDDHAPEEQRVKAPGRDLHGGDGDIVTASPPVSPSVAAAILMIQNQSVTCGTFEASGIDQPAGGRLKAALRPHGKRA